MAKKYQQGKEFTNTTAEAINHVIPKNVLKTIENSFGTELERWISPPLDNELASFLPSQLLKDILKNKIAIPALLTDFRLIRVPFRVSSVHDRQEDMIRLALFIHVASVDPNLIRQAPIGKAFKLEMDIDLEQLQKVLQNHHQSLKIASQKIESHLLDTMVSNVHPFSEIQVDSIDIKSNEEFNAQVPDWNYQNVTNYKQNWNLYTEHIESEIKARERTLFTSVYDEVAKLSISKRQDLEEKEYGEEKVPLHTYMKDLESKINHTQQEISHISPNHNHVQADWREFADKKTKKLFHQFKFFPTNQMVIIMYVFIWASLLFPYFKSIPHGTIEILSTRFWMSYLMVPLILVILSLVVGAYVRRKLRTPITDVLAEVDRKAKDYANILKEMPGKYEHYLKQLYRLFQIRKQYNLILEESRQRQQKNVLARYHQAQLEKYVMNVDQLQKKLRYSSYTADYDKCVRFVDKSFYSNRTVAQNEIYSPLSSLFDVEKRNLIVEIRGAKVSTTLDIFPLITSIKLQLDKVYNV
ncbi:hypothetical protein SAMN05216225_101420 [Ornithinibacillus halophilus]|uniref:Uncharacterized protein n=2 Tax=Ornithinibacillus halophilus TaxID=930117 RepID=A0A1M5GQT0_9BACI|nr:hypothetical protein SAMN05216225_101420 [Ornithinibacillus halophilus]